MSSDQESSEVSVIRDILERVINAIRNALEYLAEGLRSFVRSIRRLFAEESDEEFIEALMKQEEREDAANARAKELLLANLNREQKQMFHERGTFIVDESADLGQAYMITPDATYNISILMKTGPVYVRIGTMCVMPQGNIPVYDKMLQLKLMMEADGGELILYKKGNFVWNSNPTSIKMYKRIRALEMIELFGAQARITKGKARSILYGMEEIDPGMF